jgi:hypothetical protein
MAFKLGKQQVAERNRLADELRQQGKTLNAAIVAYNAAVGPLSKALDEAVEEYNDILERARTLTGTVVDAAQQEFDGKSQRWQEGDKGNRVRSWIEQWEINLGGVDIDPFSPLEKIDPEINADAIGKLTVRPDT